MKYRTWPILVLTFGTLIVLIAFSGVGALRRARQTYAQISELHERYRESERILTDVRSEIHITGLLTRDFLLDPSHISAGHYREQLLEARATMAKEVEQLRQVMPAADVPKLQRLSEELDKYWDSLDPLFEWSPQQKSALSALFLRKQVLPRRDAALSIAREIRDLTQAYLDGQREQIDRSHVELAVYISRMLAITLSLGLLVAAASVYRITRLEHRSESHRKRRELAEEELRRLSQQLVEAQEEERRSLSRELHDEVGQTLTALRMELRNLQELRTGSETEFSERVEATKQLAEQALRSVRDIAKGLRPSILDDLGLGPALQWQAREYSRRYGIPVTVQIEGSLNGLSDRHRTCVYRVVQESLTNCARHANAREIRVAIHGHPEWLSVTVQDDGVGFDPSAGGRGPGLGLIGIQERVRELGGRVAISSHVDKGTVLSVRLPAA